MGEMSDEANGLPGSQGSQVEDSGLPREPAAQGAVNEPTPPGAGPGSTTGDAGGEVAGQGASPGPVPETQPGFGQEAGSQPGSQAPSPQETSREIGTQTGAAGIPSAPIATQPGPAPSGFAGEHLGKRRNPIVVVVLSFITFGIYFLYWYGTINAEMRRHDPRIHVTPVLAVLAQFVPIVNLVSGYNTSERVKRLEIADGIPRQISPVLSVLLMIFLGIGYPIQVQMHLNAQWDHHRMRPDPR